MLKIGCPGLHYWDSPFSNPQLLGVLAIDGFSVPFTQKRL